MKTRIIIVNDNMNVGGTTSALISLLHHLDYTKYDVTLLLQSREGEFLDRVPDEVKVITTGFVPKSKFGGVVKRLLDHAMNSNMYYRILLELKRIFRCESDTMFPIIQRMITNIVRNDTTIIDDDYDVAISYMELWPTVFTAYRVHARRKIAWLHLDYIGSHLDSSVDRPIYAVFDAVVTVSEQCLSSFRLCFPEYASKATYIENFVPDILIKQLAEEQVLDYSDKYDGLTIVTVCRLKNRHKGIDRAVNACKRLVDLGIKIRWCVVGDGPDRYEIEKQIAMNHLEGIFVLIGARKNPYPYIKMSDIFALPSRYEGKPIVVTEAQIIGRPVIVTAYASAAEQVIHGVDGIIVENSDQSFIDGVVNISTNTLLLRHLTDNAMMLVRDESSIIKKFYAVLHNDNSLF